MPRKDPETARAYSKQHYEENKERILAQQKLYALQHKEEKALYDKEYRRKNHEKKIVNGREYWKENKETLNAKRRLKRASDPEYRNKLNKQERKSKQSHRLTQTSWRKKNREKLRAQGRRFHARHSARRNLQGRLRYAKNPQRTKSNLQQWRKNHPAEHKVQNQRRNARKRALPDTLTPDQWRFALDYFHQTCAVCGNGEGFFWTLAMDHWLPLTHPDCPGTVATNIIPLCHGDGGCNNRKGKKYPHNWLVQQFGTKKASVIEARIAAYFAVVA